MISQYPSPNRRTCLCVLHCGPCGPGLWVGRLNTSGFLAQRHLSVDPDRAETVDAGALLAYIAGFQIIHFDAHDLVRAIQDLVEREGYLPVDNPVYDIAPIARRLTRGTPRSTDSAQDMLARVAPDLIGQKTLRTDIPQDARTLHALYMRVVKPRLTGFRDLNHLAHEAPRHIPRAVWPRVRCTRHISSIPALRAPVNGWRSDPWSDSEAAEIANRFVDGADLRALSRLTSRSPRAIAARLQRDRIATSPLLAGLTPPVS